MLDNRCPEEDPSSGKLESTHPSRTSVKYDQVFFGVESIMRVNAASLDIRDATTSTPGTLNDLTTDLIMANNNRASYDGMWSASNHSDCCNCCVWLTNLRRFEGLDLASDEG